MNLRFLALTAAFVLAVAAGGCAAAASQDATPADTLTVFAAASLAEPFRAVADAFEADNPGVKVTFNFAGSQALRTQLEHGARADVFASADWEQMAAIRKANLLGNAPEYFATNRMAVVAPAASSAVQDLDDLARPEPLIGLRGRGAPVRPFTVVDDLRRRVARGNDQ